jgi:hypothetical protein
VCDALCCPSAHNSTLGATDPFFDAAATTLRHPFHEIDEGAFLAAFDARLLATTSRGRAEAAILQVDASSCIMRGSLGAMLNDILGRSASRAELAAWFTVRVLACAQGRVMQEHCPHKQAASFPLHLNLPASTTNTAPAATASQPRSSWTTTQAAS